MTISNIALQSAVNRDRIPIHGTKKSLDLDILSEAIIRDSEIINTSLREGIPYQSDIQQNYYDLPIVNPTLCHLPKLIHSLRQVGISERPYTRNLDGSLCNIIEIEQYCVNADISDFDIIGFFNILHRVGVQNSIPPEAILRAMQRGLTSIAGEARQVFVGYEHNQLCCPHPQDIPEELALLSLRIKNLIQLIACTDERIHISETNSLREALSKTPFCSRDKLASFTNKELIVYTLVSEVQRFLAYIHPWYHRVGRTSEECGYLISTLCDVPVIAISSPKQRSTYEGYERGIAQAIVAIPLLRSTAIEVGMPEELVRDVSSVFDVYDFLAEKYQISFPRKILAKMPLRAWYGRNVFPDPNVMTEYFRAVHTKIMELLGTFDLPHIINDPHTIHLTGQLIGRGTKSNLEKLKQ